MVNTLAGYKGVNQVIGCCKILAVVPARMGSQGITKKNLQRVSGKTLIAHVGDVIGECDWIDAAVISTDCDEAKNEGASCGLECYSLRPEHLSTNEALVQWVWAHAHKEAEAQNNTTYDVGLLLEPTSPLRLPGDLYVTANAVVSSEAESAVAVSKIEGPFSPYKVMIINNNRLHQFTEGNMSTSSRQNLPEAYSRNGVCYAQSRERILSGTHPTSDRPVPIVINHPVINIDTPWDLEIAQSLYKVFQNQFRNPDH